MRFFSCCLLWGSMGMVSQSIEHQHASTLNSLKYLLTGSTRMVRRVDRSGDQLRITSMNTGLTLVDAVRMTQLDKRVIEKCSLFVPAFKCRLTPDGPSA